MAFQTIFCKYRCDCDGAGDSHDLAKGIENAVRTSFGQTDTRTRGCGGDRQIPEVEVGGHPIELVVVDNDLKSLKQRD